MEINFSPETEAKLKDCAATNATDPERYVQQAVEYHLDYDAWFRQQVHEGLEQLDGGESIAHEEVGARIEKLLRS